MNPVSVGHGARVSFVESGSWPDAAPPPNTSFLTVTSPSSPYELPAGSYSTFRLEADEPLELAAPDGGTGGQTIRIRFHNVSAGPLKLAFSDAWAFGSDLARSLITNTPPDGVDWFGAVFDAPSDRWVVLAYARGYTA